MTTLIENYINGNLTDARMGARRFSFARLINGLREYGYGAESAIAIAAFLKQVGSFEDACRAELSEKEASL